MKRFVMVLMLILAISGIAVAGNTISYPRDTGKPGTLLFSFTDDLNSVSLTSKPVSGVLNRITINSTGTETAWVVTLKDDIGVTLFTKTDCNSVLVPYGYAISQPDNESTPCYFRNMAVCGPLVCTILDVNFHSEIQTISIADGNVTPDAGTYTISYGGQTTSAIAYGATTSAIDTAIEALSTIGTGNVTAVAGTAFGYGHDIVITGSGTLAQRDMSAFTINTANLLDTGNNEQQTITRATDANNGHWHITYDGVKTGPIAWDAAKAVIDANLNATYGTGKIVSTAAGGIAANEVILTFSGTGVAKTDVNAVTLDYTALLNSETPVAITASESLKGKADVIPTATVTETLKGGSDLSNVSVNVFYTPN